MKRYKKEAWDKWKNSPALNTIDNLATGFSFLFVFFIFGSIISAAIFRRNEVDWGMVLPPLVILVVFCVFRWIVQSSIHESCKQRTLYKRKQQVKRITLNAELREGLIKNNIPFHYDNDGNIVS